MTPESLIKPSSTEHMHQVALFAWAALHREQYPQLRWMFAIPNGGSRGDAKSAAIVGGMLKAEGVRPGVSDIFLPAPTGYYHGLFIEMKKPGGKPQQNQLDFGAAMEANHYKFAICDHWEKARDLIIAYLS